MFENMTMSKETVFLFPLWWNSGCWPAIAA